MAGAAMSACEIDLSWRDVAELVKLPDGFIAVTFLNGHTYELLLAELRELIATGQVVIVRHLSEL